MGAEVEKGEHQWPIMQEGRIFVQFAWDVAGKFQQHPYFNDDIVDGRNPKQPPGMYKTLTMVYLPYQLVSRISSINRMMMFFLFYVHFLSGQYNIHTKAKEG